MDELITQLYQQDKWWADLAERAKARYSADDITYRRAKRFLDTVWSQFFSTAVARRLGTDDILNALHNTIYPAAESAGFGDRTFVLPDITLGANQMTRMSKPLDTDLINAETDRRFWDETNYKPGQPLDPSNRKDREMIPFWLAYRDEIIAEHSQNTVRSDLYKLTTNNLASGADRMYPRQLTIAEARRIEHHNRGHHHGHPGQGHHHGHHHGHHSHPHGRATVTARMGADDIVPIGLPTTPPEGFRESIDLNVSWDRGGKNVTLTGTILLRDRRSGNQIPYTKSIVLDPIISVIAARIIADNNLSHSDTAVSGFGSFFKSVVHEASAVANSAVAKSLWNTVAPIVASTVPGGSIALAQAEKMAHVVSQARKGVPHAVASVKAIEKLAVAGNPNARQAAKIMQSINRTIDQKAQEYGFDDPGLSDDQVSGYRGGGGYSAPRPQQANRNYQGAAYNRTAERAEHRQEERYAHREREHEQARFAREHARYGFRPHYGTGYVAPQALPPQYQSQDQGQSQAPQDSGPAPQDQDQGPDPSQGSDTSQADPVPDDVQDQVETAVSGWWFNIPYRSTMSAVAGAVTGHDFPGFGIAQREMFSIGSRAWGNSVRAKLGL